MILPSFGAFTGGLDVTHDSIAAHFKTEFNVHILGMDKVYSLSADRLAA
jgi:metallophosphoesterase superfamily enzyme